MTEKQLISQLKKLKDIQPNNDWVVFTKEKILKEEEKKTISILSAFLKELQMGERFVFQHKMAFASVLMIVVMFGLFGFAQNSMPGDSLFAIKKITEQSQSVFIADNYKSIHNLEIAGKRLDDLQKIAQNNDVNNLASALSEYEETVAKANETLGQAENIEDIALEIKELQKKENMIRSLGIEINSDLDNTIKDIVGREIESLEESEEIEEIKELFERGEYYQALEKILTIE